jgi:mono/diheme cytochrome c family protein
MESGSENRNRRLLSLLGLFFVIIAGVAAVTFSLMEWSVPAQAKRRMNPVPPTAEAIGAGMDIYMEHCQSCHGENGDGKGKKAEELSTAPADFTSARGIAGQTDGELFWKISEGHRPMPAFKGKLSEEERWQAVDYIRTFAKKPGTP